MYLGAIFKQSIKFIKAANVIIYSYKALLGLVIELISEKLAEYYTKAEDKYFDVLDFLDSKGLPVYAYSDFFENKGIPSFVVTIAIFVILIILLLIFLTYQGGEFGELTLSLKDADGKSMKDVHIEIADKAGNILFVGNASDGDKIKLNRALSDGEKISISATKAGYQAQLIDFTVGKDKKPSISFSKEFSGIEAKIRLLDSETGTIIHEASVLVNSSTASYKFDEDTNGIYRKTGVPEGVTLLAKIVAEGYNDYEQQIVFNSTEVREIELDPSDASLIGKATIAISVKGEDNKAIDDAKITVINTESGVTLISDYTVQGNVFGEVPKGKALRITVEKQGYLTYDSEKAGENVTIRESEKQLIVTLTQGGKNLRVNVSDVLGVPLEGATVQIFQQNGIKFAEQTTTVSGTTFSGLDPNEKVFITGYLDGYLPTRQEVEVSSTEEVNLILEKVTPTNSARLDIYALDKFGVSVNGVNVTINEIKDGNYVPYGITGLTTGIEGYVNAVVAVDKTFEVIGETEVMIASTMVEVKSGDVEKKVYLEMQKKPNIIEMKFIDAFGKDVYGTATISGIEGGILYDGNISNSRIFFDAEQKEVVEVQVVTLDGNVFTENVTVKGEDYVEVIVYNKDASTLSPQIEFVGIESEAGDIVKGITPGAFYWAKFTVAFPTAATKAGVHFRAGADNVAFAESENFGLYDLSFQNSEITYSYSYTPTPEPGNEVVDRANAGAQGQKNKWVEGTIANPNGTYTIKVKMRAEDFTAGKVQLNYRAWAVVGSDYYRTPQDTELGTDAYSENKSGLYAQTSLQEFTMYESLPECSDNICMTINFVDEQENFIDEEGFEALQDKVYGLEVELTSTEADYVQLNATTDSNNIEFTSTQTGSFNFVRDADYNRTGKGNKSASAALSITADGKQKARFYFMGNAVGPAQIDISASGQADVTKSVLFKVVKEKKLLLELSEMQVMPGKNFTVRVTDEGLKGVENALIKILDKDGKVVKSIVGDGTDGKGKNGYYRVQNNLSPGLYTVEVSAPGYATEAIALMVSTTTILTFPEALEAKLPLGQKTMVLTGELANNSEFTVQNISVQTEGEANSEQQNLGESVSTTETGKFKVLAITPFALGQEQKQMVQITVTYTGENDDTADETVDMTITGMVEGKFATKVTSSIHMVYNKKLDASCLQMTPSSVTLSLIGNEGTSASTVVEVTNNCEQEVFVQSRPRKAGGDDYIEVSADNIELQQGETKNITVNAENKISRANTQEKTYGYEIVYDSNVIKKTLKVNVKVVNPAFALNYPRQLTLWLTQNSATEKAVAAQPIFVTNVSSFPVENIGFAVQNQADYASGTNVNLEVLPATKVSLEKGQAITPPKVVYASASSKVSEPTRKQIIISGRMGQLQNRTGQSDTYNYYNDYASGNLPLNSYTPPSSNYYANTEETLGLIDVTIFYSGFNCLEARVVSSDDYGILDYMFPQEGGQMAKKVAIYNGCAEPVAITGAMPAAQAQSNQYAGYGMFNTMSSIMLSVQRVSIPPGATAQVNLTVLTAIPNIKRENYQVALTGVSEVSQTPITSKSFPINIYSGADPDSEHVKSTSVEALICGPEKKKETVTIPKVSDNANCGEAYCDAKNAAKYVAEKIRQIISKANSQGYSEKNGEATLKCLDGSCTFEEIGMNPQPIEFYLQNDALTADLLHNELNSADNEGASSSPFRESMGANGFMVESGIVTTEILKATAFSGLDRRIFLDGGIRGCGYYRLTVNGAFRIGAEGLDISTPVLGIKIAAQNGKVVTKDCKTNVTNLNNFNPIDKGLTPDRTYGTLLATIESENYYKEMATSIADLRYKAKDRVTTGSGNRVKIVRGALENALAMVCVEGGDKKTITVTVDDSVPVTGEKKEKDVFQEAVTKMVADALAGAFTGGDNCLVKTNDTYTCVKLVDYSKGKRSLVLQTPDIIFAPTTSDCDATTGVCLQKNSESCTYGTIYSNINEKLDFKVVPNSLGANNGKISGIKKIMISGDDRFDGPQYTVTGASTTNTTTVTQNNPTQVNPANPLAQNNTPTQPQTPTATEPAKPSAVVSEQENITKLSFADPTPVAPTEPTQPTVKALNGTYYEYELLGGNIAPKETSKAIELFMNKDSKENKYYRNIKICITPGNVNIQNNNKDDPYYIAANGVMFDVEISNKSMNEATVSDRKTITVKVGTKHPYDLVKDIIDKKFTKVGPNYRYYFTLMWKGEPNSFDFGEYAEGLKRAGEFEKYNVQTPTSGVAGTTSADDAINNSKLNGIKNYMLTCSATAAVCNGVKGGIVGVLVGAAMDCVLPGLITFRTELADNLKAAAGVFKFLEDVSKKVPLIGEWMSKNIFSVSTSAPTTLDWKAITIEGGTAGYLNSQWAQRMVLGSARVSGGLNKATIASVSETAADTQANIVRQNILANLGDISADQARKNALDEFIAAYKKEMKDVMSKSMSDDYAKMMKRSSVLVGFDDAKSIPSTLQESYKKALGQMSGVTPGSVLTEEVAGETHLQRILGIKGGKMNATQIKAALGTPGSPGFNQAVADFVDTVAISPEIKVQELIDKAFRENRSLVDPATGNLKKSLTQTEIRTTVKDALRDNSLGLSNAEMDTIADNVAARYPTGFKQLSSAPLTQTPINRATLNTEFENAFRRSFDPSTGAITRPIRTDDIASVVRANFVDPNIPASEIDNFIDEFTSSLNGSRVGDDFADTMNNALTKLKTKQSEFYRTKLAPAANSIDDLSRGVIRETRTELDAVVKAKVGPDEMKRIAGKVNGIVSPDDLDDSLKVRSKLKKIFNLENFKSLARGIGCGILSNLLGMYAYNSTVEGAVNTAKEKAINFPSYEFQKGHTYQMIIYDQSENDPAFVEVTAKSNTYEVMTKDLVEHNGELLVSAKVNNLLPEQRELGVWPIKTNLITAKQQFERNTNGLEYYPENDDYRKQILSGLRTETIQKLIYLYTSEYLVDKKSKNTRQIQGANEGLVIAIIDQMRSMGQFSASERNNEASNIGTNKPLETKVKIAVDARLSIGNGSMNEAVAKKIFPQLNDKEATKFVQKVKVWESFENNIIPEKLAAS